MVGVVCINHVYMCILNKSSHVKLYLFFHHSKPASKSAGSFVAAAVVLGG
jgi:hypothetical protein